MKNILSNVTIQYQNGKNAPVLIRKEDLEKWLSY